MPDPLVAQLDGQVEVARRAGSSFYAVLLERMRADAEAGGPVRTALAGHERDRVDEWDAFRLLAGVHRLVLGGEAPDLERHYPSTGGDGDAEAAWPGCARWPRGVPSWSRRWPTLQTNAPTRAKALVGGLCLVSERTGLPLRLLELGVSGSQPAARPLPLRAGRRALGPESSPVRFVDFFSGGQPPLGAGFAVAQRAGCDLNPIDPTTEEGRLTLLACIFPDQSERFGLLEQAIAVARETPARLSAPTWPPGSPTGSRAAARRPPPSSTTRSSGPTYPTLCATLRATLAAAGAGRRRGCRWPSWPSREPEDDPSRIEAPSHRVAGGRAPAARP